MAPSSDPPAATPPPGGRVQDLVLSVNGHFVPVRVDLDDTLLDVLRGQLRLTATKRGCDVGACGACTVLVDGRRVNACLVLAVAAQGQAITTLEGVPPDGAPHALRALQAAFVSHDALQCGFCTPGQVMSALGYLLEAHPEPWSRDTIREGAAGNLCRCGAYPHIVSAIRDVALADAGRREAPKP